MNEQPNARITKIVAKMIQAIHGRPRQTLGKLTAADAESAIDELDAIDRKNEMKRSLDAKALERIPAADDLRKGQLSSGNVDEEMRKIHEKPHRVLLHRPAPKGDDSLGGVIAKGAMPEAMQKVIKSRFDSEK